MSSSGHPASESLAALIENRADRNPSAAFLEDARSDRVVSYGRLADEVAQWSSRLRAANPQPAAVIIDVDDPLDFAVVHLAVVAAGLRSVPVNPDLGPLDLAKIVALIVGETVLVTDRDDRDAAGADSVLRLPAISGVDAGQADAGTRPDRTAQSDGTVRPDLAGQPDGTVRPDLAGQPDGTARPDGPVRPVRDRTDVGMGAESTGAVLLFTSGSTGTPKGVELSEEQLLFVARGIARHNELTEADRGYNSLPLFHVNAEVVGLVATLVAGASLVLDRRFHRTGFWELMRERRITWINAVPAILAVLARGGELDLPDTLRFVRSASAPLPDAVRVALGTVPLVVSYGMTEAASQITATPLRGSAPGGSVGIPIGSEIQVRDDADAVLASGSVGSLWIRGPGIVRQYFAGAAADRFDDAGWLRTGDLGSIDDAGFVFLSGRSDDVINRGGEKVYPAEVEEVLLGDERVREAVVVGRPDPILHQVPIAYVMTAEGVPEAETDDIVEGLRARCERDLPRYKRPVEISVVADLPRAPTGKIQRSRVREQAAAG
jgi:acyl-CoA synthetase (AMP-forming)/AMP-acid ligase II